MDDDEYDFSAPKQKVKVVERIASKSPVSGPEVVLAEHLFDPHKYALTRFKLQRGSGPLGFEVTPVNADVLQVTKVIDGQAAAKTTGIEEGMYLLSIDGKRIKTVAQLVDVERSSRHEFLVAVVKKRPSPWKPNYFPLPSHAQRKTNHQYFLFRLDPTDGTKVGTGIGERGNFICVTQITDNSAGRKAGVQVGDRMLSIDDQRVDSLDKCKKLVQQAMGNPFDMIVERPPPTPAPAPAPPPTPVRPPPPPVESNDNASAGVPQTPMDVSIFLDAKQSRTKALGSIRQTTKKKKKSPKAKTPQTMDGRSVRLDKQIKSSKLKKP